MGLFNLGKKKDIPSVPQPPFSEPELQQQELPQTEEINFDEFSDEVPTPPSDLPFNQVKPVSPGVNSQARVETRELPSIEMSAQAKTGQESFGSGDKVIYELPDFLDEETKALAEVKQIEQKKEPAKRTEPVKQASQGLADSANRSFLKSANQRFDDPANRSFLEPKARVEVYNKPISYAEKSKTPVLKEPFMDINRYFDLKDDFETIRKLISTTQDKLEHEAMLSKEKSDKYQAVAETINYLQEKLMLMDTKLFES